MFKCNNNILARESRKRETESRGGGGGETTRNPTQFLVLPAADIKCPLLFIFIKFCQMWNLGVCV